ncbi:MAG: TIGR03915 family putative DNA repair protein [Bacteroidota bacterium]
MVYLVYDSSFGGLLTAVFECFERKPAAVHIQKENTEVPGLFSNIISIYTDEAKALRVWKGIQNTGGKMVALNLWKAWLSEQTGIEDVILQYTRHLFNNKSDISGDYNHPAVLHISKVLKMIGREKHRMEAFVRFRLLGDGSYYASIEPDFDVLPLISEHFRKRYADQRWIIHDLKRNYALSYDLVSVSTVEFTETVTVSNELLDESERQFNGLWNAYFDSTNIKERKNTRLHMRHVPKRYWKYLTEKLDN